jgi:alkanesulfonate monooxygenase SsuD/methylene tetrahydromethanopterin reductase-like flavin-dependent oxidoreductase (luciferase family)
MMKLGIYLNTQHPEGNDPARHLAQTLEQARLIRSLGFDSIWAGEHHATPGFHIVRFTAANSRPKARRSVKTRVRCR